MTLTARIAKQISNAFTVKAAFVVDAGVTILFGASGSGKTTLLRCLAGLARPDAGRIVVGERVLFDSDAGVSLPSQQRRVGYVFQQLALFPHLTVRGNIKYGIEHLDVRERQARVDAIAGSFRIAHLMERRPSTISGGERQRVALARSLVTDPSLLLLDEPLSALDYATQSRIIADLRAWNDARKIPILYVTHSHREVFALGERVIVMERGAIVADGPPNAVMEAPTGDEMAQLAGFENVFDATVVARHATNGTMECRIGGSSVDIEVPLLAADTQATVRLAIRAGDILLATERPRGLSARNLLPGIVESVRRDGTTVVAMIRAGHTFEVHLTLAALHDLALDAGVSVWLVIKTHSFRRVPRD